MALSNWATRIMQNHKWQLACLILAYVSVGCSPNAAVPADVPTYRVRVLSVFPHDPSAFSQGLVVEGETCYEGTGHYGSSTLRRVDLSTGEIQAQFALPRKYFGEGITILGNRIYQLTWKERICVVYDKATMKAIGSLQYSGEGWGLTTDGEVLYMSDGTSTIRVLDPQTLRVQRRIRVKDGRRGVGDLNELEFVDGKILANVWYLDKIAEIDPTSGRVTAWIDCSNVYPAGSRPNREHVLNGIAYDKASGRMFITGKNWPKLYEIEVLKPE